MPSDSEALATLPTSDMLMPPQPPGAVTSARSLSCRYSGACRYQTYTCPSVTMKYSTQSEQHSRSRRGLTSHAQHIEFADKKYDRAVARRHAQPFFAIERCQRIHCRNDGPDLWGPEIQGDRGPCSKD